MVSAPSGSVFPLRYVSFVLGRDMPQAKDERGERPAAHICNGARLRIQVP